MNKTEIFYKSLEKLERYVEYCKYIGYDPYDALNSEVLEKINSGFIRLLFTQFFVYSPLNFRYFFRTTCSINPKAVGLILSSYCKMRDINLLKEKKFLTLSKRLVNILLDNCSKGYSGYCWGFNFNWQDLYHYTKKGVPTIVVTSFVGNSFLDLYKITKNKKYLEIAESSCHFILNDLNIIRIGKGFCFSYTPIDKFVVHDANLLGASFLSRVYSITKDDVLIKKAKQAFDFSMSYQKNDGSWIYGVNPITGKKRNQIDYHQGFIIDSLCDFMSYSNEKKDDYIQALIKGAEFYIAKQFDTSGRSKWRLPWRFPIDIHHQAQGIITFSKINDALNDKRYLEFANRIALWTIENMQDETGYFYYQKWPFFTNKIPYMRWGQAWMMLALSTLLETIKKEYK